MAQQPSVREDTRRGGTRGGGREADGDNSAAATTPGESKDDSSRSSSTSPDAKMAVSSDSASTPNTGIRSSSRSSTGSAPKTAKTTTARKPKASETSPKLFTHLSDATAAATSQFQVITDCLYGAKRMGSSDHDAFECDCAEERVDGVNVACGEDSDCINRATKMECVRGDCNCGTACQNQRFQRKQYARVSVIETAKKGFGLRADADLQAHDFIYEYIGEVINEPTFRRRMLQYDEEGIRHFYFMSLTKNEFVDATRKGNLGRFCNHSCRPNCYVDKWVVGEKLRMGIFAARPIRAGEELVFDYNVDRYGAEPQPCYCGESNCTGFIGGKTQTERATKLPQATMEALGIEGGDVDGWDTAVVRKARRKKPDEDDEDYVNSLEGQGGQGSHGLTEDGVTKVMAALMQCKEKWIAVKLLARIQSAAARAKEAAAEAEAAKTETTMATDNDTAAATVTATATTSTADSERVLHRVVRMHGYQILSTTLTTFADDDNVVLQVLDVLDKLPRLTRNKIADSKIEGVIEGLLATTKNEDVTAQSRLLLGAWSKLETGYRIPRKVATAGAGASAAATSYEDERRRGGTAAAEAGEDGTRSGPLSPFHGKAIPKGPRSNVPQRQHQHQHQHQHGSFFGSGVNGVPIGGGSGDSTPRSRRGQLQPHQRQHAGAGSALPAGWFEAKDANGATYYYAPGREATWKRPMQPAVASSPAVAVSKAQQKNNAVQEIINSIVKQEEQQQMQQLIQQQQQQQAILLAAALNSTANPIGALSSASLPPSAAPAAATKKTSEKSSKPDYWRSLPIEKQQKIYENTLFPHIKSVTDQYRKKLPKEELKKFAKEISKKLVASDYKNNRVTDPTQVSTRVKNKIKPFVRDFFDRAVAKYNEHMKRVESRQKAGNEGSGGKEGKTDGDVVMGGTVESGAKEAGEESRAKEAVLASQAVTADDDDDDDDSMSIDEDSSTAGSAGSPSSSADRKRKRTLSDADRNSIAENHMHNDPDSTSQAATPSETTAATVSMASASTAVTSSLFKRRFKDDEHEGGSGSSNGVPTPPPPPPPPEDDMVEDEDELDGERDRDLNGHGRLSDEQRRMREQEEELMRENEEALRAFEQEEKDKQGGGQ